MVVLVSLDEGELLTPKVLIVSMHIMYIVYSQIQIDLILVKMVFSEIVPCKTGIK